MKSEEINANNATISCYSSASARLYVALTYQGEVAPTSNRAIINKEY